MNVLTLILIVFLIVLFPLQVIATSLVVGLLFLLSILVVILQAFITAINDVLDS